MRKITITVDISIHALLAESDPKISIKLAFDINFYPRSPCGERLDVNNPVFAVTSISIHALLAESDRFRGWLIPHDRNFYPRSPCGERRHKKIQDARACLFLSTLSLRRATPIDKLYYFTLPISIHALLAESDNTRGSKKMELNNFYPRSPCGERPVNGDVLSSCFGNFYPRSPCGERQDANNGRNANLHFYPRSPCGERLTQTDLANRAELFLSTLSLRRATGVPLFYNNRCQDFYPRSPCGERPGSHRSFSRGSSISIHALLAESDQ